MYAGRRLKAITFSSKLSHAEKTIQGLHSPSQDGGCSAEPASPSQDATITLKDAARSIYKEAAANGYHYRGCAAVVDGLDGGVSFAVAAFARAPFIPLPGAAVLAIALSYSTDFVDDGAKNS